MMIEANQADSSVFDALYKGQKVLEEQSKVADIGKFEDLKDRIDDQQAEMEDKQKFFEEVG